MSQNQAKSYDDQIRKLLFEKVSRQRPRNFALRMAPMIDITFLLLIFFLVTAKFRPQEDILPMVLPSTSSQTQSLALIEPLVISLDSDSSGLTVAISHQPALIINENDIDNDILAFLPYIKNVYEKQGRTANDPVELICSEDLKWNHLVKIYNLLFGLGITDITFPVAQ